ncbi:hypothetical protein B0H14DRAFT_2503790 [Mycena olivaceomarginata]|nr:hypothetical protein B0H14DRAFT_2503790 [Mycena olivaceomarginata]
MTTTASCFIPSPAMAERRKAQGLIGVSFEPGSDFGENDLTDWCYDNARQVATALYKATDSQAPTLLALYDDVVTRILSESKEYDTANGSAPGSETITGNNLNLSALSRRTYTLLSTIVDPEARAEDLPGKYLLSASFEITPENENDFNKWYDEEHMALVARIPGWKRGRRYKLVGHRQLEGGSLVEQPVSAEYLALHELDNGDFAHSAEIRHARNTEWAQRVIGAARRREVRAFRLHQVLTNLQERKGEA